MIGMDRFQLSWQMGHRVRHISLGWNAHLCPNCTGAAVFSYLRTVEMHFCHSAYPTIQVFRALDYEIIWLLFLDGLRLAQANSR